MLAFEEDALANEPIVPRTHRARLAAVRAVLISAVVAGTIAAAPPTADATPQRLCAVTGVPEYSSNVVVKTLKPWESVTVAPGGRIWAGVWFTGENGPEGWNSTAPSGYPLPGARTYSLIGRVSGQSWQYVGASARTFSNNTPYNQSLYARVNDNQPGNGSGAFSVTFCYYT
jgi:hypothetical protein